MPCLACRSIRVRPGPPIAILASLAAMGGFFLLIAVGLAMTMGATWSWHPVLPAALALEALALLVFIRAEPATDRVIDLVDGALRIRRAASARRGRLVTATSVEDGYAVAADRLVLRLASGAALEAQLDESRADQVLDHLGIALARRTLAAPIYDARDGMASAVSLGAWLVALVVAVSVLPVFIAFGVATAVYAACTLAIARWRRPHVVIGLDGIRVVGVPERRFIPYADIRGASRSKARVLLDTKSGELTLALDEDDEAFGAALVARIDAGRATSHGERRPALERLDRGGRTVAGWRGEVRELALAESGFRDAALLDEDLEALLADRAAPLDRRVGAALALLSRDPTARERIRVVAATSAEPHARRALDAVAADEMDDHALARALDRPALPRR